MPRRRRRCPITLAQPAAPARSRVHPLRLRLGATGAKGELESPPRVTVGEDEQAHMTAITRGLVRLYKEHYGLGPTRARSWFCGREVIVCVMEETLTTKEHTMRDAGDAAGIHETRQTVQAVMEPEMRAVVEKAL